MRNSKLNDRRRQQWDLSMMKIQSQAYHRTATGIILTSTFRHMLCMHGIEYRIHSWTHVDEIKTFIGLAYNYGYILGKLVSWFTISRPKELAISRQRALANIPKFFARVYHLSLANLQFFASEKPDKTCMCNNKIIWLHLSVLQHEYLGNTNSKMITF